LKIDNPILVGHSFGGMVAAVMASAEPRRVSNLVLAAPAGLFLDQHPTLDIFATTRDRLLNAAFHDPESEAFMTPSADPTQRLSKWSLSSRRWLLPAAFYSLTVIADQANASIVSRRRHY
jgi:pimeloyl-ACP methyl ester carboxylesterase